MHIKKVLIITYYWPPSGGAGVQRWLKFVKYLPEFNIHPYVLSVDPQYASFPVLDESLEKEVPESVQVFKTKSREPFSFYKKITGESEIPYAGFVNQGNPGLLNKIARVIRGNLFIPDARVGWNKFALKKAIEIIQKYEIDTLITTSPPHSTQLIGLKLKNKTGVNWIADLRDPWTDIYYYKQMYHTIWAKKLDEKYETKVLETADFTIVVSKSIKKLFENKFPHINKNKIHVIPNGYDEPDFNFDLKSSKEEFIITHIGTLSNSQDIDSFLSAFKQLSKNNPSTSFLLRFVGNVSSLHQSRIKKLGLTRITKYYSHVSHHESIKFMMGSSILLLSLAKIEGNKGILSGKLFEYLAVQRPILGIGPPDGDASDIIKECNAGKMFDYVDMAGILNFLNPKLSKWKKDPSQVEKGNANFQKYARKNLTMQLAKILE